MKSINQKGIIPARTQSQDKKFLNQSTIWSTKVRSGQVTAFLVCEVFSLSFQAVVWLTKTAVNHRVFFSQVWGQWMDLKNSNGFELRNFYFQPYRSFCRKFSSEMENWAPCSTWSSIWVFPKQESKKSFYTFEDIDLQGSHSKLNKKPSETLGADWI